MKRIVQEKKSGGKELMKMMGLPSWMNWFFHYLDAILTIMISLIIIVILVRSVFSMKSNVSPNLTVLKVNTVLSQFDHEPLLWTEGLEQKLQPFS